MRASTTSRGRARSGARCASVAHPDRRFSGKSRRRPRAEEALETSGHRRGCRTNPRRARWIASKGGLQKRPSRPSGAAGPLRGRRARWLWCALPRARCGFCQTVLCDSSVPSEHLAGLGEDDRFQREAATLGGECRRRPRVGFGDSCCRRIPLWPRGLSSADGGFRGAGGGRAARPQPEEAQRL
jgi:hypothetical protein